MATKSQAAMRRLALKRQRCLRARQEASTILSKGAAGRRLRAEWGAPGAWPGSRLCRPTVIPRSPAPAALRPGAPAGLGLEFSA